MFYAIYNENLGYFSDMIVISGTPQYKFIPLKDSECISGCVALFKCETEAKQVLQGIVEVIPGNFSIEKFLIE